MCACKHVCMSCSAVTFGRQRAVHEVCVYGWMMGWMDERTCVHGYVQTYVWIDGWLSVCVYTHQPTHPPTPPPTHTHTCTCTNMCVYTYIYVYDICMCVYIYVCMHTLFPIHRYAYVCLSGLEPWPSVNDWADAGFRKQLRHLRVRHWQRVSIGWPIRDVTWRDGAK